MNIKTVLARLHSALDLDARMDHLLLLPRLIDSNPSKTETPPAAALIVGYDGSANSQAALDLAFCVAHQMQLATQQQVMIHVVYVVTCEASTLSSGKLTQARRTKQAKTKIKSKALRLQAKTRGDAVTPCGTVTLSRSDVDNRSLEEIDRVLWQARCLAEEWRGSFTTHLRFGDIATELEAFAVEENAALLFLGCHSASHPLVQQLKGKISCSVIGIPQFGPVHCPV